MMHCGMGGVDGCVVGWVVFKTVVGWVVFKTVVGWVVFKNVLWGGWCLRLCCGMGGV